MNTESEKEMEVLHAALRRLRMASAQLTRQQAWYEGDPTDANALQYAQAWVEMVSAREHLCRVAPPEMRLAS